MARQLKSFAFSNRSGNRKYPWEEWSNGEVWKVEEGKDFVVPKASFVQAAYQYARRCGRKVRVQQSEGYVVFQFYDESEVQK